MYDKWPIAILVFIVLIVITIALIMAGCQGSFLRVYSPTDPNKVIAEAKGKAANDYAAQLVKERALNQKMNATAQQATNRACYSMYGVGALCVIAGIIGAWIFPTYRLKAIGLVVAGIAIFAVTRGLQQYLPIIEKGLLALAVIVAVWYMYKYHDTIFKTRGK